MMTKYGLDVSQEVIDRQIRKIVNQVYKLLPMREEGIDWEKPLQTIVEEMNGLYNLLVGEQVILFAVLCKLEGLFMLTNENDFLKYRRTIFECLSLLNSLNGQS